MTITLFDTAQQHIVLEERPSKHTIPKKLLTIQAIVCFQLCCRSWCCCVPVDATVLRHKRGDEVDALLWLLLLRQVRAAWQLVVLGDATCKQSRTGQDTDN